MNYHISFMSIVPSRKSTMASFRGALLQILLGLLVMSLTRLCRCLEAETQKIDPNDNAPECQITCDKEIVVATWFFSPTDGPLPVIYKDCDVNSSIQDGGSCELPVHMLYNSSDCNATNTLYTKLNCPMGSNFHIVFTDKEHARCDKVAYLHVEECDVPIQNIAIYGKAVDLRVIFFLSWRNLDNKTQVLQPNLTMTAAREEDDIETIPGLENIMTITVASRQGVNASMPPFLYQYRWPLLGELNLADVNTTPEQLRALTRSMPRLQTLKLENSITQVPIDFPWDAKLLYLPRNLSRTKVAHAGMMKLGLELGLRVFPRFFKLEKNAISDLSLVQFKGRLDLLSLSHNEIEVLGKDTFTNVSMLQHLMLNSNKLQYLPPGVFRGLSALTKLDLCHNQITNLPVGVFQGLTHLKSLNLNYNRISTIASQAFSSLTLPKLNLLDLSHNQIEWTHKNAIDPNMPSLQTINLEYNNMTHFSEWMFITWNLTNIKLGRNELSFEMFVRDLDDVDVRKIINHNTKSSSYTEERYKPIHDKTIDLRHNVFTTLNFSSFSENPQKKMTFRGILNFFKLDLTANEINCDCHTFAMYEFLKQEKSRKGPRDFYDFRVLPYNFESWKCAKPEIVKGVPIVDVDEDVFKCQKLMRDCPANCTCFEVTYNRAISVNCSGRNLTQLPKALPAKTEELLFSHNRVRTVHNASYLRSLRRLDISYNYIEEITDEAIDSFDHMDKVNLNNNLLRRIPPQFKYLRNVKLTLGGNKLICDCHSVWLIKWTWFYKGQISDVNNVICSTGVPQSEVIFIANEEDFVCEYLKEKVQAIAIAFGTVLPLVIIGLVLAYKFRGEIKVFLFTRFNWHPFDGCDDQDIVDKLYDAFVSYNKADVNWVLNTLQPTLETPSKPFRLCIHERDFKAGGMITDNVLYSVKYSRRMIMVLTKNFLKSEWCRLEFKSAHRRVLRDRSNYLIVILFDGINIDDLDEDMKLYLRTNTYIEYDSKWFWERMHYAMPKTPLANLRGESFSSGGFKTLLPTPTSVAIMQLQQNLRTLAKDPSAQVPKIVMDSEIM